MPSTTSKSKISINNNPKSLVSKHYSPHDVAWQQQRATMSRTTTTTTATRISRRRRRRKRDRWRENSDEDRRETIDPIPIPANCMPTTITVERCCCSSNATTIDNKSAVTSVTASRKPDHHRYRWRSRCRKRNRKSLDVRLSLSPPLLTSASPSNILSSLPVHSSMLLTPSSSHYACCRGRAQPFQKFTIVSLLLLLIVFLHLTSVMCASWRIGGVAGSAATSDSTDTTYYRKRYTTSSASAKQHQKQQLLQQQQQEMFLQRRQQQQQSADYFAPIQSFFGLLFISLVYTVAVVAVDYEEPALRQSLFAAPALQRFVHISTHADDDDNSNDASLQDPTAFLPTEADLYGMTKSESLYGNDEDELPDNGNEYVTPDASSLLSASHPHRRRVYNRAEERAEDMALTAVNHKATHHRHRLRQHHLSAEPTEPIRDTVKCFSCMSKLYEAVWPALAHVYKRPLNFTDDCNADGLASGVSADDDADDDYSNGDGDGGGGSAGGRALLDSRNVPVTHCSTICVGMWEETTVAGVRIRAHIRGCADDVLHGGFNDTVVALYRWMHRDSCRDYRKRELFKLSPDRSDESTVHVCTCYADYCNSRSSSGAAFLTTRFNWASTALATLISTLVFAQQHILSDHWAALR